MIGILKFLRGYVQIKVWGFAPERFLNLCSNKGILLWDIKKENDIFYMNISLSGFKKLRPVTRKTRVRVVILKRCGLPFLLPGILKKRIFLTGFLLACFFWYWSGLHIWKISIDGNLAITDDVFYDFLTSQGICIGIKSSEIDIESLEKEIRKAFMEVTWTSAKLSGTELIISVKENDAILSTIQESSAVDLFAEKDGVIVDMIVRNGIPQVKIGDHIEAGMILVSGKVPVYNEDGTIRDYQYTHADADIIVKRTEPVLLDLPFYYTKKVYTGRENKQFYIKYGEKTIYLGKSNHYLYYDTFMEYHRLSLLKGLKLPIHYGYYTYREYQNKESVYTLKEAEKILNVKYLSFLTDLEEKGVQIIEKNVRIDTIGEKWILQGQITVKEKIGNEVLIEE